MAKKNVKEETINTARRLFNQKGMAAVSMRDISQAMQMSVGNLTYHFPRKEDLMEAVAADLHQYYRPPAVPNSLQQFNAQLARMQNDIQQRAFYFWHHGDLDSLPLTIKEVHTGILKDYSDMLHAALIHFYRAGWLEEALYDGHHTYLCQAVLSLCIHWTPQCKLEESLDNTKDFLDCVWGIMMPCLTPAGRQVYREKIQKVRVDIDALNRLEGAYFDKPLPSPYNR